MSRLVVFAALVLASAGAAAAQERRTEHRETVMSVENRPSEERFVVSGDECGASRYQHLLGREYARVYNAALLPSDSIVQSRAMRRTLEYTPYRLNVVVGGEGRIIAIGCF